MTSERLPATSRLEAGIDAVTRWLSWIWLALIGLIVGSVGLRVLFGIGRIELEELQWHLYAVGFLIGIAGCGARDRHVRVDVFRERMSPRARARVDVYGIVLLQLPFLTLLLWSALPFAWEAWSSGERSAAAGGLPHRFLLKGFLVAAAGLWLAAAVARLRGATRDWLDGPAPDGTPPATGPATGPAS